MRKQNSQHHSSSEEVNRREVRLWPDGARENGTQWSLRAALQRHILLMLS